jgi:hypothetical protein
VLAGAVGDLPDPEQRDATLGRRGDAVGVVEGEAPLVRAGGVRHPVLGARDAEALGDDRGAPCVRSTRSSAVSERSQQGVLGGEAPRSNATSPRPAPLHRCRLSASSVASARSSAWQ